MIKSCLVQDEREKLVIERGENCAMLNGRVLIVRFLTHSEQIICYRQRSVGKDLFIYQWKNIILLVYSKREKAHDLEVT